MIAIPGTKTPRYLSDNAGAAGLDLDLSVLDDLPAPEGARY